MTRNEAIDRITRERTAEHCFVKFWSSGHKLVDFDLLERFTARPSAVEVIEGYELLDLEQMWQALLTLDPDKLVRVPGETGEMIEWDWQNSEGCEKKTFYPFTPEGIMTIIDDEFFA